MPCSRGKTNNAFRHFINAMAWVSLFLDPRRTIVKKQRVLVAACGTAGTSTHLFAPEKFQHGGVLEVLLLGALG